MKKKVKVFELKEKIKNGFDIDQNNGKLIKDAIFNNDYKLVKFLLDNNCKIDYTGENDDWVIDLEEINNVSIDQLWFLPYENIYECGASETDDLTYRSLYSMRNLKITQLLLDYGCHKCIDEDEIQYLLDNDNDGKYKDFLIKNNYIK